LGSISTIAIRQKQTLSGETFTSELSESVPEEYFSRKKQTLSQTTFTSEISESVPEEYLSKKKQTLSQATFASELSGSVPEEYLSPKAIQKLNSRFTKAVEELDTVLIHNWIVEPTRRLHLSPENVQSALLTLASLREPKKGSYRAAEAQFRDQAVSAILKECCTGQDLECTDVEFKATPLILAAACGRKSITELLISKKASLAARDGRFGRTALSWAARNNFLGTAGVLLEALEGNDDRQTIHLKDNDGRTALDYASMNGHDDMAELLKGYEASWKS
jgi:hypothetical protein